jgi:hypothetical protein
MNKNSPASKVDWCKWKDQVNAGLDPPLKLIENKGKQVDNQVKLEVAKHAIYKDKK